MVIKREKEEGKEEGERKRERRRKRKGKEEEKRENIPPHALFFLACSKCTKKRI